MKDQNNLSNLEKLWEDKAKKLTWFERWNKVLEWNEPFSKWFIGGKLNASYLCVDQHIKTNPNKIAIYWEDEFGRTQTYTYQQLYNEINKFSLVLKKIGVKKSDVIILYLPMIPQAIVAMLSAARIGAIHSVVL